ncbi:MAG: cpaB [Friedmanniella sp.]|nr:cpaB [Friedmanniella sp.]
MTGVRRPWWRELGRAASWHRRKLAALAAVAAVVSGVAAATPEGPATVRVVRLEHALAGGTVLQGADLDVADVPVDAVPDGALTDPGPALGRLLAAPAARGQVLTELALVLPRPPGSTSLVLAPLRLTDPDLAALVHPGDLVDVLAADPQVAQARVVAAAVRVVTVPRAEAENARSDGALVLVAVDRPTAAALARAAVTATLSVIWRS